MGRTVRLRCKRLAFIQPAPEHIASVLVGTVELRLANGVAGVPTDGDAKP